MNDTQRIWGLQIQRVSEDPYFGIWKLLIRNPFELNGNMYIGVGEKILKQAKIENVKKFLVTIGGKEIELDYPDLEKTPFEEIPSKFENGKPMKIYHLKI